MLQLSTMRCVRARWLAGLCLGLLLLSWVGVASAQSDATIQARELFTAGRELMEQGRCEEAIEKFEATVALAPSVGALISLGDCHTKLGRTASAWNAYQRAEAEAVKQRDEDRAAVAHELVMQLAPRLCKLTVEIVDAPSGLSVERGGIVLKEASYGLPIPVDPGEHEIVATAPGRQTFRTSVVLERDGEAKTVVIPALLAAGADGGAPGAGWPGTRIAGVTLLAVGVAGIAVGAVSGVVAINETDRIERDLCVDGDRARCAPGTNEEIDRVGRLATLSSVGFGVGGAAVVAGVVLTVVSYGGDDGSGSEPHARVVPVVGPGVGGAWLVGSF